MWWGYHGFAPFGCFFFVLFAGFVIFRIFAFRRYGRFCNGRENGRFDAEAILKRRLASGEINEAEYQRIMETLKK